MAEAVEAGVGPLLEATLAPQSGLHAFNLLGNAVLAEVDAAVAAALPGARAPNGCLGNWGVGELAERSDASAEALPPCAI